MRWLRDNWLLLLLVVAIALVVARDVHDGPRQTCEAWALEQRDDAMTHEQRVAACEAQREAELHVVVGVTVGAGR